MKSVVLKLLAWSLLLCSAVASFIGAVLLNGISELQTFVLVAAGPGSLGNWLFCLLTLSIGMSVYVIKGIEGGGWLVTPLGVTIVFATALGLLLFGLIGLGVIGVLSAVAAIVHNQRRRNA